MGCKNKQKVLQARVAEELEACGSVPTAYTPRVSGTFIRRAGEGRLGRLRAQGAALASTGGAGSVAIDDLMRKALGPAKPVDSTLRFAVGQHELGEAAEMLRKTPRPHASHIGVEPILREQIAMMGDADAVRAMSSARQGHPDDALVQKLIRRAGGTPDSPLPLGGRQQRAVERMLDSNVQNLHPASRQKAIMSQHILGRSPYVPKHVSSPLEMGKGFADAMQAPSLGEKLRGAGTAFKDMRAINKFIKKGL